MLAFLIEDDTDLRTVFENAITGGGFDVSCLGSDEALRAFDSNTARFIVYDLPAKAAAAATYLNFVNEAQSRPGLTAVLAITADDRVAAIIRMNGGSVLVKPVGFVQLSELAAIVRMDLAPAQPGELAAEGT